MVNVDLQRLNLAGIGKEGVRKRRFPPPPAVPRATHPAPAWAALHQEVRRPGVTGFLLWQEYQAACPTGYRYSKRRLTRPTVGGPGGGPTALENSAGRPML